MNLALTLYKPPFVVEFYQPINILINLGMLLAVYYTAFRENIAGSDYMVFASSFALFCSAFSP